MLGQIRAELRSNVYKVIDEDETRTAPTHRPAAKLMNHPNGCLMAEIVAEFFEFYEFRHSLSVFMPESNLGRNERRSRDQVALDAGLDPRAARLADASILEQLVGLATGSPELRKGGERGDDWHSSASSTTASSPPPAAPAAVGSRAAAIIAPKVEAEASPRGKLVDADTATTIANTANCSGAVSGIPHAPSTVPQTGAGGYPGTSGANSGHGTADAPAASTAGGEEHDEASHTEEGAPEEVPGKHRKPRRKPLPPLTGPKDFLGGANPGAVPGQLPPLKASVSPASLSGASDRCPEEVSLSESSVGVSQSCEEVRDEVLRLDRRLARLPGRPGAGTGLGVSGATPTVVPAAGRDGSSHGSAAGADALAGVATAATTNMRDFNSLLVSDGSDRSPEVRSPGMAMARLAGDAFAEIAEMSRSEASANDVSAVSAESPVLSNMPGAARSRPRSANSSPANSSVVVESPLRSPPISPGSQHTSSASPVAFMPTGGFSPAASPKSSGSVVHSIGAEESSYLHGIRGIAEDANAKSNESISIDESSGDGDLDLALSGTDRRSPAAGGGALKLASATVTSVQDEEVDEDIDEEDDANNSHESWHSSEAAISTGALSGSGDAGF